MNTVSTLTQAQIKKMTPEQRAKARAIVRQMIATTIELSTTLEHAVETGERLVASQSKILSTLNKF